MNHSDSPFLTAVARWLMRCESVKSAVLFGSSARRRSESAPADAWSDYDLHVITSRPREFEQVDWQSTFPSEDFRFQVVRPATGGVRKATVLFGNGQIDLVLLPAWQLRMARWGLQLKLDRKIGRLQSGLNEVSTCVRSGYRFLKGESDWGPFYAQVARQMSGVRIGDTEACQRAAVAIADLLWILQKLQRGELSAAQYLLHCSLAGTNFALLRECRLRNGLPLPSFGLGRRVETLLSPNELTWVQVDARLNDVDLERAAWTLFAGLKSLMQQLIPTWTVPSGVDALLAQYRKCGA